MGKFDNSIGWSPDAKTRLARAPFFVRPFIKKRAEQVARERGMHEVTDALLSEIKGKEMKKG